MRIGLLLSALISLVSSSASAGQHAYDCRVLTDSTLSSDGTLVRSSRETYLNHAFRVDRKSGVVIGGSLDNEAYPTRAVVSPGNEAWPFVVTWQSAAGDGGGRKTGYLAIKEWKRDFQKPFVLVTAVHVLTGICT